MENRIPKLVVRDNMLCTRDEFQAWSDTMAKMGMLYHYEDDPSDCLKKHNLSEQELERIVFALTTAGRSRIDIMACALKSYKRFVK